MCAPVYSMGPEAPGRDQFDGAVEVHRGVDQKVRPGDWVEAAQAEEDLPVGLRLIERVSPSRPSRHTLADDLRRGVGDCDDQAGTRLVG